MFVYFTASKALKISRVQLRFGPAIPALLQTGLSAHKKRVMTTVGVQKCGSQCITITRLHGQTRNYGVKPAFMSVRGTGYIKSRISLQQG